MAPPASKPSTRSTDPSATSKTKRKSESTYKSPTTPNISTAKKSPATTNALKPKTQLTLKTIKEQPKVTPVYNKTSTESTDITREIKKEKLDEARVIVSGQFRGDHVNSTGSFGDTISHEYLLALAHAY